MQQYKIESLELAIADLEPNPWNPNEMSDFMLTKAEESLDRFGQVKRIIVRPHPKDKDKNRYQILDGFHRVRSLGQSGVKTIRCEVIYDISDNEAKRLGLALNDIHGENDRTKLGQLLCDIQANNDEDALPWDSDHLAHLMALGSDEDDEEVDDQDFPDNDPTQELSQDNCRFVTLKLTPAAADKLEQCVSLLRTEVGNVRDQKELLGLVVERLCEGYL